MGYDDILKNLSPAIQQMGSTTTSGPGKLQEYASNHTDEMGAIYELRAEARSEFRRIYASIIDSTIAAMY